MPKKPSGNPVGRPKEFCEIKTLEAAMRVFAEKGYENASLSDLTSAMKINRFSMYASFGNKEALYVKAMECFNQVRRQRLQDFLSDKSAREGVRQLLRDVVIKFTDADGHGLCFVIQAPLNSKAASPETRTLMVKRRAEVAQALRARLELAVEQGELPADACAADLAEFYAVMIQGFALQAQHGGSREDLFRVIDIAMSKWPEQRKLGRVRAARHA
jgi:AcrR family transcriptional regulator